MRAAVRIPTTTPRFLPSGIAAGVMPMSGDVALQIHYNATGKPETDQTWSMRIRCGCRISRID